MLKKNQLVIVLLTLVLMLSIYYIKSPFDNNDENNEPVGGEEDVTGRLEELSALRLALNDERGLRMLELDAIIASSEATVSEKNVALEEKQYLNSLTEKELLLETELITSGYQDAFVHASSYGVEITVVSQSYTSAEAAKIMKEAKLDFRDIESVLVTFKTVQEVMGEASNS